MNKSIEELAEIAHRTRNLREAGIALVLSSLVLTLFLFVPFPPRNRAGSIASATIPTSDVPFITAPIEAKAAVVYDLATGEVLYAKHADAQLPLASLTKLLTVYAALTELPSTTSVTILPAAAAMEAPHVFAPGATLTLTDLARITLTGSLNDGAAAIAETTAKAEGRSTPAMLASAASGLSLAETYAVNGNGLDISPLLSGGYGSAEDIARLAGALVAKAPAIAEATTHPFATATDTTGKTYTIKNTDPFTAQIPGLLLSKTGYTDLADGNLALVFDVGLEHPVAVVVLGSSEKARFTDGMALVAATFAHFAGLANL